ncbi:hypothetical protein AMST5_00036 [freshwater sediment metagenome]|uniref:TIGR02300 family protein n=1 Tax=freshwater sediment metagenome TaxID=556182 RepID=A0AA48LZ02_9ZZZZ
MAKAELGEKRRCLSCSTPFFDLNRNPIVCPKCSTVFQIVEVVRSSSKYARMRAAEVRVASLADQAPAAAVSLEDSVPLDDEREDESEEVEDVVPEVE